MTRSALATSLACFVAVLAPHPSARASQPAEPEPASEPEPEPSAAELGGLRFEAGDFLGAADAFEDAYAQTGDAVYLFSAGVSLQRAQECKRAVAVLERFRETGPDPRDDRAAAEIIEACAEPESPPPPSEAVAEAPPPKPDDADGLIVESVPRPDRVSWGLLGGGAGVLLLGGALYGASYAVLRPRARMESEFEVDARRSRQLAISGVAVMSAGVAAMLAGTIRLIVLRRRDGLSRTEARRR